MALVRRGDLEVHHRGVRTGRRHEYKQYPEEHRPQGDSIGPRAHPPVPAASRPACGCAPGAVAVHNLTADYDRTTTDLVRHVGRPLSCGCGVSRRARAFRVGATQLQLCLAPMARVPAIHPQKGEELSGARDATNGRGLKGSQPRSSPQGPRSVRGIRAWSRAIAPLPGRYSFPATFATNWATWLA